MTDHPTNAPAGVSPSELSRHFLEAEGEQIVRDMAHHVGDEVHAVLKRHGMTMRTASGAIGMGVLAAAVRLFMDEAAPAATFEAQIRADERERCVKVAARYSGQTAHNIERALRALAPDASTDGRN
jgi:hypothetical protein